MFKLILGKPKGMKWSIIIGKALVLIVGLGHIYASILPEGYLYSQSQLLAKETKGVSYILPAPSCLWHSVAHTRDCTSYSISWE